MGSASGQRGDDSSQISRQIRLGGAILGVHRQVCAFFSSHDDQYRVLLPFIKDGFDGGEKAVHIIDPRRWDEHVRRLGEVGIDATAAQQAGQLDLRDRADAHLRGGFRPGPDAIVVEASQTRRPDPLKDGSKVERR
jgi:MEDS: MEthanogen/methylotroph, DcmR Sensory domain